MADYSLSTISVIIDEMQWVYLVLQSRHVETIKPKHIIQIYENNVEGGVSEIS